MQPEEETNAFVLNVVKKRIVKTATANSKTPSANNRPKQNMHDGGEDTEEDEALIEQAATHTKTKNQKQKQVCLQLSASTP